MNNALVTRFAQSVLDRPDHFGYPASVVMVAEKIVSSGATDDEIDYMLDEIETTQSTWEDPTEESN